MKIKISDYFLKIKVQMKNANINFEALNDFREKEIFQFILSWSILYFAFILLNLIIDKTLNLNFIIPNSLLIYINSSWGAFLVISLLLSTILNYFYNDNIYINDTININNSIVSISKTDFQMSVFLCKPPILHSKKDFTFFITNFRPLSLELRCEDHSIYVILYNIEKNSFERKKIECFNFLNSMFSKVAILTNSELKKFICDGHQIYLNSNKFKEVYNLEELKKIINFTPKTNQRDRNNCSNELSINPIGSDLTISSNPNNSFLLMLFGKNRNNNVFGNQIDHYFRGIRMGSINLFSPDHFSFFTKIKLKLFKNTILSCIRIPEKDSPENSINNLEKSYFFILHKFFNYIFINEEKSSEDLINIERTDRTKQNNNFFINLETISVDNDNKEISSSSGLQFEKFLVTNSASENNLKNVIFQYTYFCQFFCPIMINEFKKINNQHKKSLTIPNACHDHLMSSDKNLQNFSRSRKVKKLTESIFNNSKLRDDFLEYINELELPLIDKICHFSSIIILSPQRHLLKDDEIINFIKNLEENYF